LTERGLPEHTVDRAKVGVIENSRLFVLYSPFIRTLLRFTAFRVTFL